MRLKTSVRSSGQEGRGGWDSRQGASGHRRWRTERQRPLPTFSGQTPGPSGRQGAAHTRASSEFLTALVERRLKVTFNLI